MAKKQAAESAKDQANAQPAQTDDGQTVNADFKEVDADAKK